MTYPTRVFYFHAITIPLAGAQEDTTAVTTPSEHANPVHKKGALVRDHLAGIRTDLANRRTFLSYSRTALACFITGLAFIKFSGHPIVAGLGCVLLPLGVIIMGQGIMTYRKMKKAMSEEEAEAEAEADDVD